MISVHKTLKHCWKYLRTSMATTCIMYRNLSLSVIVLLTFSLIKVEAIDPLVETKVGLIRGLRSSDGQHSMFLGIPYATVDEGNPFGPSIPHNGFSEVFEAYDDSAICPQTEEFNNSITGTLDCLHLNIYVPNSASSQTKLPVLVWIYGGGFRIGFSGRYLYGPSYLVRHDVILVTLNYRLGPYGFMCLDNPQVPGNQGLKDQQIALKWVKNNIEAFGGDVNKITLFGESAGAASVSLHTYQQEAYFNQVIMQSGGALFPWAIDLPDASVPLALAEHLGLKTNNESEALTFLATADPKLVIAATNELHLTFDACVEKEFDDVENFIKVHPINAISSLKTIPALIGMNNRECLGDIERDNMLSDNAFGNYLAQYLNFSTVEENEMENLLRHFYMGDNSVNEDTVLAVVDFCSDLKFNYGVVKTVQRYLDIGAEKIFQYMFSYVGSRNFVRERLPVNGSGAAHADEISYLFDISYINEEPTPEDQAVIDRMTTLWTNFAKYGNPTPETSELLPVIWPPVTQEESFYIDIDTELTIKQRPFHDRMAFWDLFYKLNKRAQKYYEDEDAD